MSLDRRDYQSAIPQLEQATKELKQQLNKIKANTELEALKKELVKLRNKVSRLETGGGGGGGTGDLARVAYTGSYNDLSNKPTIPTIPSLSKGTTVGSGNAVTDITVSGHTVTLNKGATFLTEHQDISGKQDKITPTNKLDYSLLDNTPSIPSAVTESTVTGWGFTKNTGTYSKPSTGIPKTDLASAVQTSLGKADSALQEHQSLDGKQDKITSSNKLDYSLLKNTPSIPSEITESTVSGWGFTKNTGTYSKPSAGIPYDDLYVEVQESLDLADTALQEHQPLKTINNQSLIGEGNINVGGGGSSVEFEVIEYAYTTTASISAHGYMSAVTKTINTDASLTPIGVIGMTASNYRLYPASYKIDGNSLYFNLANASATSVSSGAKMTFFILCTKG